jgi:hypothetical protein
VTRPPAFPTRDAAQDAINQHVFGVFQAALCQTHFWEALDVLSDRTAAPDPLQFGYSRPWGQGLGLDPSRWIPAAHLCAFWSQRGAPWRFWVAPVVPHATNGHGMLRHAKRAVDLGTLVDTLRRGLARVDTGGRDVAVVLNTSRHSVDVHGHDPATGRVHSAMVPSGRGGHGWMPWPKPLLAQA